MKNKIEFFNVTMVRNLRINIYDFKIAVSDYDQNVEQCITISSESRTEKQSRIDGLLEYRKPRLIYKDEGRLNYNKFSMLANLRIFDE